MSAREIENTAITYLNHDGKAVSSAAHEGANLNTYELLKFVMDKTRNSFAEVDLPERYNTESINNSLPPVEELTPGNYPLTRESYGNALDYLTDQLNHISEEVTGTDQIRHEFAKLKESFKDLVTRCVASGRPEILTAATKFVISKFEEIAQNSELLHHPDYYKELLDMTWIAYLGLSYAWDKNISAYPQVQENIKKKQDLIDSNHLVDFEEIKKREKALFAHDAEPVDEYEENLKQGLIHLQEITEQSRKIEEFVREIYPKRFGQVIPDTIELHHEQVCYAEPGVSIAFSETHQCSQTAIVLKYQGHKIGICSSDKTMISHMVEWGTQYLKNCGCPSNDQVQAVIIGGGANSKFRNISEQSSIENEAKDYGYDAVIIAHAVRQLAKHNITIESSSLFNKNLPEGFAVMDEGLYPGRAGICRPDSLAFRMLGFFRLIDTKMHNKGFMGSNDKSERNIVLSPHVRALDDNGSAIASIIHMGYSRVEDNTLASDLEKNYPGVSSVHKLLTVATIGDIYAQVTEAKKAMIEVAGSGALYQGLGKSSGKSKTSGNTDDFEVKIKLANGNTFTLGLYEFAALLKKTVTEDIYPITISHDAGKLQQNNGALTQFFSGLNPNHSKPYTAGLKKPEVNKDENGKAKPAKLQLNISVNSKSLFVVCGTVLKAGVDTNSIYDEGLVKKRLVPEFEKLPGFSSQGIKK